KQKIDVAFDGGADDEVPVVDESKLDTTPEELHGFNIVRAIAAEVAPVSRITMRDAQSYCSILFDDNNRKPIARMHFNGKTKFVMVFDANKEAVRHDVEQVEDLFSLAGPLKDVIRGYTASA